MNAKRFQRLQEQAEELRERKAKAEGALGGLLKQLREEFDVVNIKAAEMLLKRMKRELLRAEARAEEQLREFMETWKDVLEE